tara:strand:- start:3778 stop:3894 length:117 start_codon:yes stop_codon:yes gene_type:complete
VYTTIKSKIKLFQILQINRVAQNKKAPEGAFLYKQPKA